MNLDNSNDIPRLVKRNGEWFQLNGHGTTRLVKGLKQPGDIIYFDGPIDVQIADVLKSEANGAVYRVTHVTPFMSNGSTRYIEVKYTSEAGELGGPSDLRVEDIEIHAGGITRPYRVAGGGLMQRWAYLRISTKYKDVEMDTGQRDRFGRTKTTHTTMWAASYDGREMPLEEVLDKCGDEGWELVAAFGQTEFQSQWLYFKRPKE